MTKKKTINNTDIADKNFKKLSIQVSLNGLSFCVADTVSQKIVVSDQASFAQELSPPALLQELNKLFDKHGLAKKKFDEVVVVHRNTLFAIIPGPLFKEDCLEDYLKFNIKVLPTDVLAFDELKNQDIVNVYVPYMNINNYMYDLYGEFVYVHNGTVLIETLLNNHNGDKNPICYVQVGKNQMDVVVLRQKQLLLYNSFNFWTKEDFTYYLLFVLEQLELDARSVPVKLFGAIEEDDPVYGLCYTYVQDISIFAPSTSGYLELGALDTRSIDFTVLNTL